MPVSRKRRRTDGPAKPRPYAYAMDHRRAGAYDRMLGNLLRDRELSATEFVVVNRALWAKRSQGSDRCQVTIDKLCEATGQCRDVVNRAIQRAISLGIVRKIKNRIRRAIGAFVRVVNDANTYVFTFPETEADAELAAEVENVSQSFTQATPLKVRESINQSAPELTTAEKIAELRARKSPLAGVFEGWARDAGWLAG